MYWSASPSMYCQRSLAAKTRVSLVFAQPEMAPDAGNGSDCFFLHPVPAPASTIAIAAAANIHPFERNIDGSPLLSVEQNLAVRRTAFANAGDVDGGALLEWAG